MTSKVGIAIALVSVAVSGAVFPRAVERSAQSEPAQNRTETCDVTVSSWDHRESIPDYLVWEVFFEEAVREDFSTKVVNVSGPALEMVRSRATHAVAAARVARARRPSTEPELNLQEALAADAILTARDDLIRAMPQESFEELRNGIDRVARRPFKIPAVGKAVFRDSSMRCELTVKGKDYPHLIPDSKYWEFHLRTHAMAAAPYWLGPSAYDPKYVEAIQKNHMPIPAEHLEDVLEAARETVTRVDVARKNGASEPTIADIVGQSRADLIRTLPEAAWLTVKKEANRTRASAVFTFPMM